MYQEAIESDGFALAPARLAEERLAELRDAIATLPASEAVRRKATVYGIRNLFDLCPAVRDLAASGEVRGCVTPVLGDRAFAVRATFFDKTPDANWSLRWHQDSVIAVRERIAAPGFHAWTVKAGVTQVRPPMEVLSEMLAIRVHLDDSDANNGPLRFLAGSHRQRWERDAIQTAKQRFNEVTATAARGQMLAMRPLTLHASSAAESDAPRRVIHLEFAADALPSGLDWRWRIDASQ